MTYVHSWVVLSRHSTQLALDAIYDSDQGKLMSLGVLFRTAYKDISLSSGGASDTDCYVAVGDVRGFDRAIFESPQLCTQFKVLKTSNSFLPQGIITGIHGNQATVSGMDYYGEYSSATLRNTIGLPSQTYPVALAADDQGGVFVALHDTGGILPPPAPKDKNQVLTDTYNYVRLMNHPSETEHMTSPSIVKVNITTGENLWSLTMETTEGRSTIAGIHYLPPPRDILVVAGSSSGRGCTVGNDEFTNSWDGYLTIADATTGVVDVLEQGESKLASDHSVRYSSQVLQDDYILGLCAYEDEIYIMGTTTGKMTQVEESGGAFILRLDVDTLNEVWIHQWPGIGVEALKCEVSQNLLFVAGHVPAGVLLDDTLESPSPDQDVFVSFLDKENGEVQWTKQIDSRRPDRLADFAIDFTSNLILVGNAMDFANGVSDIYTLSILQANGFHDWQALPRRADPLQGDTNGDDLTATNGQGDNQVPVISDEDKANAELILIASFVPLLVILVIVCGLHFFKRKSRGAEEEGIFNEPNLSSPSPTVEKEAPEEQTPEAPSPSGRNAVV